MWSKTVAFASCLWLMTFADVQSSKVPVEVTHEDIRTAIISMAHTLRETKDKLERHEYRERQLGEQLRAVLSTIENKQKDQNSTDETLKATVKGLEESMSILTNATTDDTANRAFTKLMLESLDEHVAAGSAELKSMLEAGQKSSSQLYRSFDQKLTVALDEIGALKSRFDALEQAPKSAVTNDAILDAVQKALLNRDSAAAGDRTESANATSQLVQETKHAVVDALKTLADRVDENERKRAASEARLTEAAEAARAFQDDVQNSFRLMSDEVKSLSDVEKVLMQTADNVLDTKRRIEYSTHQILMEVTDVIDGRSKEQNESMHAALTLAVKTVLDAQAVGMANLSVKIETEISQVWRQIGIMYQTLTDSAATLDVLQKQTDVFVNGTVGQVDGMNNKVTAIAGRMTEVDDNLNYLLGRLSLVTQEFKEIKIGLGEALESIRVGLQTVQGNKTTVDLGPGPNPIDEEPLSENINQNALSKTVYTVS